MKDLIATKKLFLLAFVIIIAGNAAVFLGVYLNRSGKPDAVVKLTERELGLPYMVYHENSGLSLHLKWNILQKDKRWWRSPLWLDRKKLMELGFDAEDISADQRLKKSMERISKEVFVVLEYDSETYQRALKGQQEDLVEQKSQLAQMPEDKRLQNKVKSSESLLKKLQNSKSRLYAVDAGLVRIDLRGIYPDRSKYIIAKGLVSLTKFRKKEKEAIGIIRKLSIENIHVPIKNRKIFEEILKSSKSRLKYRLNHSSEKPRYRVKLAYGSRLEPWIVSVERIRY
jgi:hypothetical protein